MKRSSDARLAMLISGSGTTMKAIIEAIGRGELEGVVPACVISSDPDAGGIAKAVELLDSYDNVVIIRRSKYRYRDDFGRAIVKACREYGADIIGQYGWLPQTPRVVIEAFPERMINQHPGPLDPGRPDFGGKGMFGRRVHCARLHFVRHIERRETWTEAIAQRVDPEFDRGAVIRRRRIDIAPEDDVESLRLKLLPVEYAVQIDALRDMVTGQVFRVGLPDILVRPEEEGILAEAKALAIETYPQG